MSDPHTPTPPPSAEPRADSLYDEWFRNDAREPMYEDFITDKLIQAEQDRDTLREAMVKLDTLALPLAFDDAAEPTAWAQVLQICRAVLASKEPKEG